MGRQDSLCCIQQSDSLLSLQHIVTGSYSYQGKTLNTNNEQRTHFSWSGFHFKPTAILTADITFLVKITCEFYRCSKVAGAENFPFSLFHSHGHMQVNWTYKEQSHYAETKSLVTMKSDSDELESHSDCRGWKRLRANGNWFVITTRVCTIADQLHSVPVLKCHTVHLKTMTNRRNSHSCPWSSAECTKQSASLKKAAQWSAIYINYISNPFSFSCCILQKWLHCWWWWLNHCYSDTVTRDLLLYLM